MASLQALVVSHKECIMYGLCSFVSLSCFTDVLLHTYIKNTYNFVFVSLLYNVILSRFNYLSCCIHILYLCPGFIGFLFSYFFFRDIIWERMVSIWFSIIEVIDKSEIVGKKLVSLHIKWLLQFAFLLIKPCEFCPISVPFFPLPYRPCCPLKSSHIF